jgi:hypothetical protein
MGKQSAHFTLPFFTLTLANRTSLHYDQSLQERAQALAHSTATSSVKQIETVEQ